MPIAATSVSTDPDGRGELRVELEYDEATMELTRITWHNTSDRTAVVTLAYYGKRVYRRIVEPGMVGEEVLPAGYGVEERPDPAGAYIELAPGVSYRVEAQ